MRPQLTPHAPSPASLDVQATKTCKDCGQTFPATRRYFYGRPTARDGLRECCKPCYSARRNNNKWLICRYCAQSFYGVHGRLYCSVECRTLSRPPRKHPRHCQTCGKEYSAHTHRLYCCKACRDAVYRPAWNKGRGGYEVPQRRTGQQKACTHCGKTFYATAGRAKARYCSKACYYAGRWSGSRQVTKACPICAATFTSKLSERRRTCSLHCRNVWHAERQAGDKSHFWRGGRVPVYTRAWQIARALVLERDGHKCTICGATERLSVHHVVPYRYARNHQIENLVTLCRSCHGREECKVNPDFVAALRQSRWPRSLP